MHIKILEKINLLIKKFNLFYHFVIMKNFLCIRKKLEPLEAYVPAVLLSEAQFKDLGMNLRKKISQFLTGKSFLLDFCARERPIISQLQSNSVNIYIFLRVLQ